MGDSRSLRIRRIEDPADVQANSGFEKELLIETLLDSIDEVMVKRNLQRKDLAHAMGCSQANITKLMRRSNNLTIESMVNLALALGMRIKIDLHPLARESLRIVPDRLSSAREWEPVPEHELEGVDDCGAQEALSCESIELTA